MDLSKIMEQAQKLQQDMKTSKEELGKVRVEGSSGGGMVVVEMSGNLKLLNVEVEKEVLDDKEMLEDLIMAAVNQAIEKAQKEAEDQMQKNAGDVLGGMNLDGFKFPGM